jgi:hypothetical protein
MMEIIITMIMPEYQGMPGMFPGSREMPYIIGDRTMVIRMIPFVMMIPLIVMVPFTVIFIFPRVIMIALIRSAGIRLVIPIGVPAFVSVFISTFPDRYGVMAFIPACIYVTAGVAALPATGAPAAVSFPVPGGLAKY